MASPNMKKQLTRHETDAGAFTDADESELTRMENDRNIPRKGI